VENRLRYTTFSKLTLTLLCVAFSLACTKHSSPPVKRYPFTGRIVSVDKSNQSAVIDGDMVQGFMEAMQMSYKVKNAGELNQLVAGDSISAEIVIVQSSGQSSDTDADYWLEKVKITGHSKPSSDKATADKLPADKR
jgi:hypothetical protein